MSNVPDVFEFPIFGRWDRTARVKDSTVTTHGSYVTIWRKQGDGTWKVVLKDHRPDLRQMIVGIALDSAGWPLCCELWPGNTTDVKTLLPVVKRLQHRFRVREVCILADRGMISKQTLADLEQAAPPVPYILGARMRRQKEVAETVLRSGGAWQEIYPPRTASKDPAPLQVREVLVEGRRYIVCLNEEERRKDAHDRAAIVAHLRHQLTQGDKSLVGNTGYRRDLAVGGGGAFCGR